MTFQPNAWHCFCRFLASKHSDLTKNPTKKSKLEASASLCSSITNRLQCKDFLIIKFILFDLLHNYQNIMLFECPSSSPRHFADQRFLYRRRRRRKRHRRQTFRQKIMSLIMSAEQPQATSSNKQSDFSYYDIPRVISNQWFLQQEDLTISTQEVL